MAERQRSSTARKASPSKASSPKGSRSSSLSAAEVAEAAVGELTSLTGKETEGVTGLQRTDDGWVVEVDVVELRRVPATTDVIASYEVTLDGRGSLQGYRRLRRYGRGDVREE